MTRWKDLQQCREFGVLFKIDADYDTVEWYGNGPAETYWDRQHGAKLGIYQNKVARQHGTVPCAAGVLVQRPLCAGQK